MLIDGLELAEGSNLKNLTVASGSTFPALANAGELFFKTPENKHYAFDGTEWVAVTTISGNAGTATKLQTPRTITITGDVVGTASFDGSANVDIAATLKGDVTQSVTFNGVVSINYAAGSYVKGNVTGATTLTLTGVPDSTRAYGLTLKLTNAGTNVAFPESVTWLGTAPTLRASGISMVTLVTDDGGTTWLGSAA